MCKRTVEVITALATLERNEGLFAVDHPLASDRGRRAIRVALRGIRTDSDTDDDVALVFSTGRRSRSASRLFVLDGIGQVAGHGLSR